MITANGIYRVTVDQGNNPTYLTGGIYRVVLAKPVKDKTLLRAEANFRSTDSSKAEFWYQQPGTFERVRLLNVFEQQGRVTCTPVPQDELNAIAYSVFGVESFDSLTEARQIEACRVGIRGNQ